MADSLKLLKDCPAMLIPSGLEVTLAAGNEINITHTLGGYFTVRGIFGIARVENKYAEALGVKPLPQDNPSDTKSAVATISNATVSNTTASNADSTDADTKNVCALAGNAQEVPQVKEEDLWDVAKTVFDPEIPVNIVDLGLIYRMEIVKTEDGKNKVEADMTLTAPGCSMGPVIANDLKMRLESLPSISEAQINIVLDPPWNTDMMSMEARMILGLE